MEHGVTTLTTLVDGTFANVPKHRPRVPLTGANTSFMPVLMATNALISIVRLLTRVTASIVTVNGTNAISVILPATSTLEKQASETSATINL